MRVSFAARHATGLNLLLAVALVTLFHGAALGFDFLWDDYAWVNDFRRHALTDLLKDNLTTHTLVSYYRPLVAASLSLQLAVSQSPLFLHAFNLAVHVLNLALVILIARGGATPHGYRLPLAVTVLAIHPALVEPVAWISGRFDLCFTTFVLVSLLAALRITATHWRFLAVSVSFLAALACKESALAYLAIGPVMVATAHAGTQTGDERERWRAALAHGLAHAVALGVAVAVYLGLRVGVLGLALVKDTAFQVHGDTSLVQHAWLVLRTFGTYLQMSLLPLWNLAPLHAVSNEASALSGYGMAGAVALALALAGLRWPSWRPLTVWMLALLPAANLVPFRLDLVQSRYLYFPLFAAALTALYVPWPRLDSPANRRLVRIVLALWLLATAATTLNIVRLWRDGVSLFSWVVSVRPESRYALENLALAHQAAGQHAQAIAVESRIAPAARSFQGWLLLARASRDNGQLEAARDHFQRALSVPAHDDAMQVSALYELALLHKRMGDGAASGRAARDAEALAAQRQVSERLCDYYRRALRE